MLAAWVVLLVLLAQIGTRRKGTVARAGEDNRAQHQRRRTQPSDRRQANYDELRNAQAAERAR